jgi:hypothetical protein
VRAYVDYGGHPGIYFLSLDAARLAPVAAARWSHPAAVLPRGDDCPSPGRNGALQEQAGRCEVLLGRSRFPAPVTKTCPDVRRGARPRRGGTVEVSGVRGLSSRTCSGRHSRGTSLCNSRPALRSPTYAAQARTRRTPRRAVATTATGPEPQPYQEFESIDLRAMALQQRIALKPDPRPRGLVTRGLRRHARTRAAPRPVPPRSRPTVQLSSLGRDWATSAANTNTRAWSSEPGTTQSPRGIDFANGRRAEKGAGGRQASDPA